ncbi:hypothetical protein NP233_g9284 [Leucocoprinus birnbaumii]|uniref:PARP-type domain-containing protein n=1 Tax=Leucocoprinus birnbaumii TaxID=56174 RepID=A0AAD5YMC9_9AGAR|nr:hypothetical protein NP233_g9284 [Leucocoprinus birnbaumii]
MSEDNSGKYLVEYAISGPRPCRDTLISAGELRFGILVDFHTAQSYAWRHWGCVTAKVLENLKKTISEPNQLEGFEGLQEGDKAKILKAWQDGHVAAEDIPETAKGGSEVTGEKPKKKKDKKTTKSKSQVGTEAIGTEGFETLRVVDGLERHTPPHTPARELGAEPGDYLNRDQVGPESAGITDMARILALLDALSERVGALDQKLDRATALSGIPKFDPYLYPLPLPAPDKPANADKLFWTKKTWRWDDRPLKYVITTDGISVSGEKREAIIAAAQGLLSDSAVRAGWHAQRWEKCGEMMKDIFVFGIERKFPEVALCANHWKAHRVAEDFYDVWRDGFFRKPVDGGGL